MSGLQFQVASAVRVAFNELLVAQGVLGLRRQQLEAAQTFQQGAARRVADGFASDFESVKAQGEVINAQKFLRAADSAVVSARVELNGILGREFGAPLEVAGSVEENIPARSSGDLVAAALAANPGLKVCRPCRPRSPS